MAPVLHSACLPATNRTDLAGTYPSVGWVCSLIRGRGFFAPPGTTTRLPVLDACIEGSEARGDAGPESDLDVVVILRRSRGRSALQRTEDWHALRSLARLPPPTVTVNGQSRFLDLQFYDERGLDDLQGHSRIWLRDARRTPPQWPNRPLFFQRPQESKHV